jgi:hypothetical protein
MSTKKLPASGLAAVRTPLPTAAVFLLVFLVPAHAERLPLPPVEQEKVNDAIAHGVRFLKKTQLADGSWMPLGMPHRVGYTALPALTLLECGEPVDEPVLTKAIHCVRRSGRHLDLLLLWQYSTQRKRQPGGEKVGPRKGTNAIHKDGISRRAGSPPGDSGR